MPRWLTCDLSLVIHLMLQKFIIHSGTYVFVYVDWLDLGTHIIE